MTEGTSQMISPHPLILHDLSRRAAEAPASGPEA